MKQIYARFNGIENNIPQVIESLEKAKNQQVFIENLAYAIGYISLIFLLNALAWL